MQHAGIFRRLVARRGRQHGQAYAEYLVVATALVCILLIAAGDTIAPFTALVLSFKSVFSAYSFTLSLP
ncbi:hypothetical protein [Paraburkholderia lacunae]|uniref:Uncharacterized protein n=1 Tax=Paraburkholderia lacunae TaxID=2211104 RepID=A0A370N8T5_9BURK|nr:hypothetical protein [Paraburkholderia lacunae]RDK01965.1 hypothetical protein DLM46_13450 [Paraburkholderia lacunae]